MIQLKEVTAAVYDQHLFNALNLCLESGISYLVEGNNGAGKTTLLKLMAGKIQPRSGFVEYDFIDHGLSWDEKFDLRNRYIHFVPAHTLHELMSAPELFYQQRYYTIENTPLPTVRDFLGDRLLNLSDLQLPDSFQTAHLLDLELTRLSNGQVKKVVILKHLLGSIPKVLLLDYPFEGLDAVSRKELSDFIDHLARTYRIQIVIADHEHPQLPKVIKKKIAIQNEGIVVMDRVNTNEHTFVGHVISKEHLREGEAEPVLEMHEVKIQYGQKTILEHINWKVSRGERWALTGRNGSGKTTLFSLIYADHPMAYSEKVFLFGKRRGSGESIWDIKKRISYLGPEQIHFLDYTTGQLTVYEFFKQTNSSSIKQTHLIDYFHIEHILSSRVSHLSHGQLQLVILISLFLSQKELLLLDEPFQFLDAKQKARVTEYLQSHLDESTTLILITHYEDDVLRWTHHRLDL